MIKAASARCEEMTAESVNERTVNPPKSICATNNITKIIVIVNFFLPIGISLVLETSSLCKYVK